MIPPIQKPPYIPTKFPQKIVQKRKKGEVKSADCKQDSFEKLLEKEKNKSTFETKI